MYIQESSTPSTLCLKASILFLLVLAVFFNQMISIPQHRNPGYQVTLKLNKVIKISWLVSGAYWLWCWLSVFDTNAHLNWDREIDFGSKEVAWSPFLYACDCHPALLERWGEYVLKSTHTSSPGCVKTPKQKAESQQSDLSQGST